MKRSTAEEILVSAGVLAICALLLLVMYGLAIAATPDTPEPQPVSRIGPDVSHCLKDTNTQPLWDCIRYVKE